MIICIMPLEQWSAREQTENAVYLDVPAGINPDVEDKSFYYGENYSLLVNHFVSLGAVIIPNPITTYYV